MPGMDKYQELFCKRIIELRKQCGKTQSEAAEEIGISNTALNNYESGARKPKYEKVKKIADYYGVSVDYLLGESDEEPELSEQTRVLLQTLRGASEREIAQAVKIISALKGTLPDEQQ